MYMPGSRRKCRMLGEMREESTVINTLPPVGSLVTVQQLQITDRDFEDEEGVKDSRAEDENRVFYTGYDRSSPYVDAWGKPHIYTVESYTKGIDNPLDCTNNIILSYKTKAGTKVTHTVKAIHIATGCMRLKVQKDAEGNGNNTGESTYKKTAFAI